MEILRLRRNDKILLERKYITEYKKIHNHFRQIFYIFSHEPLLKMSLTSSSSGWESVVRIVKEIRNKIDNIVHNYPKLPEFKLVEGK